MKYYLIATEKLETHNWNMPLEHILLTYEDAIYWGKRMIELGSIGVTLWKKGRNDIEIIDVLFPERLGINQ